MTDPIFMDVPLWVIIFFGVIWWIEIGRLIRKLKRFHSAKSSTDKYRYRGQITGAWSCILVTIALSIAVILGSDTCKYILIGSILISGYGVAYDFTYGLHQGLQKTKGEVSVKRSHVLIVQILMTLPFAVLILII